MVVYVLNNPLVYTDPSGYSFWTKVRKPLAAVAVMVATYGTGSSIAAGGYEATAIATDAAVTAGAVSAEAGAASLAAAGVTAGNISAAFTIAGGFASGGITGGNIESAVLGAIQATASMGIGDATYHGSVPPSAGLYATNVLAHAALGCGMSAAQGGSCKSGALAGGFSAAAGPVVAGLTEGNFYGGLAGRAAAGCAGSMIGGGGCEAGAVTAAFDYLYNDRGDVMRGELAATRSAFRGFHEYEFESRCAASDCPVERTREELKRSPAPGERKGDTTSIKLLGNVAHYDSDSGTMNTTVSSGGIWQRHLLRPGSVSRWVDQQGDYTVIRTYGVGWGWLPRINESDWLTGSVWRSQDRAIFDRVKQPAGGK